MCIYIYIYVYAYVYTYVCIYVNWGWGQMSREVAVQCFVPLCHFAAPWTYPHVCIHQWPWRCRQKQKLVYVKGPRYTRFICRLLKAWRVNKETAEFAHLLEILHIRMWKLQSLHVDWGLGFFVIYYSTSVTTTDMTMHSLGANMGTRTQVFNIWQFAVILSLPNIVNNEQAPGVMGCPWGPQLDAHN